MAPFAGQAGDIENAVEITPAMIEAGVDAYRDPDFDPRSPFSVEEMVERVYRAMVTAAHGKRVTPKADRTAVAGS